jgi:hypothetical protein
MTNNLNYITFKWQSTKIQVLLDLSAGLRGMDADGSLHGCIYGVLQKDLLTPESPDNR